MLLVCLLATVSPASAQRADALAKCHDLTDASLRLRCYDEASGWKATAQTAPAAGTAGAPAAAAIDAPAAAAIGVPAAAAAGAPAPVTTDAPVASSLIGAAWLLDPASSDDNFAVRTYKANYFLPVRYTSRANNAPFSPVFGAAGTPSLGLDDAEAKFQISFKARLWKTMDRRWSVWAAYTQQNQWQLYNNEISRPFRETNYEPELMLAHNPELEFAGFRWRLMTLSLNHQSNGRADPLSRSWNRLVGGVAIERGGLVVMARAWYRFKEGEDKDDNPDITDRLGHGDLTALYRRNGHTFKVAGRGNLSGGKGAGEFTWSSPQILGPLRLYAQLFTGYGESMIDYNWNQTTFGVGFALNDLF